MDFSIRVFNSEQKLTERTVTNVFGNGSAEGKSHLKTLLTQRWAVSVVVGSFWRVWRFACKPTRKQLRLVVREARQAQKSGELM